MSAAVNARHAYAREFKAKASSNSTETNVPGPQKVPLVSYDNRKANFTHRSQTKGRSPEYRGKTIPKAKNTFRSFAGQRHADNMTSKRGGGGRFNWGNDLEYGLEEDVDWDSIGDNYETDDAAFKESDLFSERVRAASLGQQELEQQAGKGSPSGIENLAISQDHHESSKINKFTEPNSFSSAWGQSDRVEAMKDRLLELERAKLAKMAPERLELMNLLADHGQNVDEDTLSALLRWKNQI